MGRVLNLFADQMILNLLFLLCCLPVVTAGAAAISLYEQEYAIWESREDQVAKSFLLGVLRNFKKGLLLLLMGILIVAVGLGIWFSAVLLGMPVRIAAVAIAALLGGIYFWILGITGRYEQKMGITFQNAYLLTFQRLPVTLLLILANMAYPALFLILPEALLSGYLFLALFFYSAFSACVSTKILLRVFSKMDAAEEQEWKNGVTEVWK